MAKKIYANIKVRTYPWYIWIFRLIWLAWLVFWADVAIGSWKEMEQRAFILSVVVWLISVLFGFVIWLIGLRKSRRKSQYF